MSCCGNRRAALAQQNQAITIQRPASGLTGQTPGRPLVEAVYFQYTGRTGLSVRGMFSQRTYHFAVSGAVLAVDGRDAPSLAAVPLLRRVRAPE
jgi:hypothetical protein